MSLCYGFHPYTKLTSLDLPINLMHLAALAFSITGSSYPRSDDNGLKKVLTKSRPQRPVGSGRPGSYINPTCQGPEAVSYIVSHHNEAAFAMVILVDMWQRDRAASSSDSWIPHLTTSLSIYDGTIEVSRPVAAFLGSLLDNLLKRSRFFRKRLGLTRRCGQELIKNDRYIPCLSNVIATRTKAEVAWSMRKDLIVMMGAEMEMKRAPVEIALLTVAIVQDADVSRARRNEIDVGVAVEFCPEWWYSGRLAWLGDWETG